MVIVQAITGSPRGPGASAVSAIDTGDVRLALSDDQVRELVRVMGYSDVNDRRGIVQRTFETALIIGLHATLYRPRKLDWPSITDRKDLWMLDLAFESGADYIVTWDQHLDDAEALGFQVLTPPGLLEVLRRRRASETS